jgi:succinoglycan biosynthesis transport protein ExoP
MTTASISYPGILTILLRRKRLLLMSGITTACLAFAVSRILPPQYSSEGNLIIENHASASSDAPVGPSVLTGVLTQVDVLQSKGLIRRAVSGEANLANTAGLASAMRLPSPVTDYLAAFRDNLTGLWRSISGLHSDDDGDDVTDRIVTYIQKHLRVKATDNSSVISVQFEAGAPDTAAVVVNAIMATYLSTVDAARDAQIGKTDQWISQQMAINWQEIKSAEQRVTQFMQEHHNLSEVQGSLTGAIQLSKDQAQLALAREDLARQQAALDTISHGGGGSITGAQETLQSKSIQTLKELEAKVIEQISSLAPSDPRRIRLRDKLSGLRAQINNENAAVADSISRTVRIARAHVQALEIAVQKESQIAQDSTVAGSTLRQLTSDLEAKRQLYVAFLNRAGQVRISAVQAPSARILFQGVPPQRPVLSFGMISLLLGFFGGVAGAAGIIMMRSTLSLKINSTDDMAIVTGLPAFGSLPNFKRDILEPQTGPLVTETFRAMWLAMHSPQNEGTAILVTSSESSEGKTTIALAMACRFAGDGFRVLLIDADLRRPRLATILKLRPEGYLESVLSRTVTLDMAVVHDTKLGLSCLLANGSFENPIRALSSDHFEQLLTASRCAYDFVILDSPPVLHVADPVLLANLCQHVIFIVEAGRVPGEQVGEATRRFAAEDRSKMVTLLTRVRPSHLDKRDHYSGYVRIAGPEHNHRSQEGLLIQHLRRHGGEAMSALLAVVTASVTIVTKAGAGGLVIIWKELRRGYARNAGPERDCRSPEGILTQHLRRCCGNAMSALLAAVAASATKGLVLIGKQLQRGYALTSKESRNETHRPRSTRRSIE